MPLASQQRRNFADTLVSMLALPPRALGRRLALAILGFALAFGQASAASRPAPDAVIVYPQNADSIANEDAWALESLAVELKSGNAQWISLEAYADDRGSRELNLALAQRRIDDISHHLVVLGVPASRIHGTSYGEERMDDSSLPMRRVEIRVWKPQP